MTLILNDVKHNILPQKKNRKRSRETDEALTLQMKRQMIQHYEHKEKIQKRQNDFERQQWAVERQQLLQELQERAVFVPEPEPKRCVLTKHFVKSMKCLCLM